MSALFDTTIQFEAQSLRYNTTHKAWGQIELKPARTDVFNGVDLIIAIDTSASMRSHASLIQWISRFILEPLNENHTLTLISFDHVVLVYTECLPCTDKSKTQINRFMNNLQFGGSTNIVECLDTGAMILNRRTQRRPAVFAVFTDGCQLFVSPENILAKIKKLEIPCPVYTFGISRVQDSGLLRAIAHQTYGVYQNIQTSDQVPMIINSFTETVLNVCAMNVRVTLKCHDGSRLITIATPYNIEVKNVAKEYIITIPMISRNQTKTIIFRLSLRRMEQPMQEHQLLTTEVTADYPEHDHSVINYGPISVARTVMALLERVPLALDYKLNRYALATVISEAIDLSLQQNYNRAVKRISDAIVAIRKSMSCDEPLTRDLVCDLENIHQYFKNRLLLSHGGLHSARMIASEYFMEYLRKIPLRWSSPTPQLTYVVDLLYNENF